MSHHYSGWPGAWCLDCGDPDVYEQALACRDCVVQAGPEDATLEEKLCPVHEAMVRACPEPGSNRCNPYVRGSP